MSSARPVSTPSAPAPASAWQVFWIFLRLGLTSFGGPVAHLGYFRDEFVQRRRWLTEHSYADLVALCQFLPGPASSQVGMALGLLRAGMPGALAAWLGFTLPSALVLALFGLGLASGAMAPGAGALHGLKVVAVAVVAQAVWGMARSLCVGRARVTLMALAACAVLLWPNVWAQVGVMLAAGVAGWWLFGRGQAARPGAVPAPADEALRVPVRRRTGAALLLLFAALLVLLPLAVRLWPGTLLALFDAFYRVGALVFGGGHVMLPLLQAVVVPPGWVSADAFLAGYGATQAVPGPLFTFAAFLGAAMAPWPGGWLGAVVCLVAIFVPSFLLVAGALPFWERLRRDANAQAALAGVNAAVVGLLLAALYQPVFTSAILGAADFGLALLAFVALVFWRVPPWAVVLASGVGGALLAHGV
ncbi:chromate efflux transporter [Simplicispira lacusdiani]|uniref:chromate efflux transporter n=1 Tax=Simplicispira lacusdiani TaxID=2213010 RepID=UPI000E75BB04|nr:chromate efflux transporter [Simplicispira lacusdiani]